MAVYNNTRKDSPISAVEFSPMPEGNVSFFAVKNEAGVGKEALKQWLTQDAGQQIIAESPMGKVNMIIARGSKPPEEILAALNARGEKLQKSEVKQKFNFWALRGWASIIGQPLQFFSGMFQPNADMSTVAFATLNMAANISNIIFGGETKNDPHRLHFLKEDFNKRIGQYVSNNELPAIDDKRAPLREDKKPEPPLKTRIYNAMKRNSVRVGEIGLRYVGSFFMAFPVIPIFKKGRDNFKILLGNLRQGEWKQAFYTASATTPGKWNWNLAIGLTYLTGKTIGFFSKIPDPYDPKPHTTWDTIREKVLFRMSTAIETTGAGIIVYDRIRNRQLTFPTKGQNFWSYFVPSRLHGVKWERDWLGAIGGALFTGGFMMRFFAPFGHKDVNMKEVDAHITDGLAKVPQDKLPQLLSDTVANAYPHLEGKGVSFGNLFMQFSTDLYRYHGKAALPSVSSETLAALPVTKNEEAPAKPFAKPEMKKSSNLASLPRSTSHQDRAASPGEAAALGA